MNPPLIELGGLRFAYGEGDFELAIDHLEVARGETVACIGPSGSGKTTLVQLMTGVLAPSRGRTVLDGDDLARLDEERRRAKRLATVGMVFQHFALLDYLTALDNILLPYLVGGLRLDAAAAARARALAAETGIAALLSRKPARLSQGERQRVALCRALVARPALVVADEPTGNLDPRAATVALDLLFRETRAAGATLFVVTHDHALLERFDRVLDMEALASPSAA